jgi:hypothetical protein
VSPVLVNVQLIRDLLLAKREDEHQAVFDRHDRIVAGVK